MSEVKLIDDSVSFEDIYTDTTGGEVKLGVDALKNIASYLGDQISKKQHYWCSTA